jgi:hypothetical protein
MTDQESPQLPGQIQYTGFNIAMSRGASEQFTVHARSVPAGESKETITFSFGQEELKHYLDKLRIAPGRRKVRHICQDEEKPVQEFGRQLYASLFPQVVFFFGPGAA